ncbi:SCO6880 family protein, partial [Klebsiella pneumoniae]|uniref:SCO6880 family protein n=1 Tax=Klebsiella pneumoniae TaxID=573 RepID=UPI0025A1E245
MQSEPEAPFDSNVLSELLAPRSEVPRKRVTFVYQPYTPSAATTIVNKDHNDARQAVRTHIGKLPERAYVRLDNAEAARQEQARGAGVT